MTLRELARDAARVALASGAAEASVGAYRLREVDVAWRDGRLESVTEATTRGLRVELYVEGRYAAVSTSDLRQDALERFIGEAVALARTLAPDPDRRLPDPELYRGQAAVDLELEDPSYASLDSDARRRTAEALETSARDAAGAARLLSVSATVSDTASESVLVQTNGFEGQRRGTTFAIAASVTAADPDGRRPEDHAGAVGRHRTSLESPEVIGRRAAERALARIGAVKGPSSTTTLVVDARASGEFVGHLLGALQARALQQKRSFLDGMLGRPLGSPLLEIRDEPLIPRALGSRLYDGEGIASRPRDVFERGELRNWYVDTYYGRKLGLPATTGSPSNLAWSLGTRSRDELVAGLSEGILVTSFLGGNCNGTTGDFSLGVSGFAIRGGRVAEPVAEMNVSGNHLELWPRLVAVGNDPRPYSTLRTPTLVFESVRIAGT